MRKKYIAINGDREEWGDAYELSDILGITAGRIHQLAGTKKATRDGWQILNAREKKSEWTTNPEPWIELAGAIANIIITDYQRNPSDYNRKMLESEYFQILTLGTIDPSSIKASENSVSNDFSPEKLEDAMIELGLTTSGLAELSGLSASAITNYLTGYSTPIGKTIFKLERAVGRSLRK